MHGTARVTVEGYADKRTAQIARELGPSMPAVKVDHEAEWRRLEQDSAAIFGVSVRQRPHDGPEPIQ